MEILSVETGSVLTPVENGRIASIAQGRVRRMRRIWTCDCSIAGCADGGLSVDVVVNGWHASSESSDCDVVSVGEEATRCLELLAV